MLMFSKDQRFLLMGIARLSVRIHQFEDATVFSLKEERQIMVVRRALKALLHDAAQETVKLDGYERHCFKSAVLEACTPRDETQEHAYCLVWTGTVDPSMLSVARNLTLPGKE